MVFLSRRTWIPAQPHPSAQLCSCFEKPWAIQCCEVVIGILTIYLSLDQRQTSIGRSLKPQCSVPLLSLSDSRLSIQCAMRTQIYCRKVPTQRCVCNASMISSEISQTETHQ